MKADRAAEVAARELSRKQRRLFELLRGEGREGRPAPATAAHESTARPAGAIPRRGPDEPAVPSFGQRRLWFIEQLQPGSPAYHVPGAVRMRGALDLAALGRSLRGVTAYQESLRTGFRDDGGEPALEISPPAAARPPALAVVDLRRLPAARREEEAARTVDAWVRAPFDLARAPLARTGLVRVAEDEHVFLLVLHHVICDIWSVGVFFRNVTALYAGRPLPELPIRYSDYALWQERVLRGEGLERLLGYWRGRLDGAPHTVELPYDRPRPAFQSMTGGRRYLGVDRGLTDRLKEVGKGEGASLYMVLLAALFTLLHRYSGQESLLVGVPVANRNRVELEGLIGLLFNTVVLRADVAPDTTFRGLLAQVRERLLAALAHQDLPFERLVDALRVERDTSRNPLYQVLFAFQNVPPSAMGAGGVEMQRYEVRETASREDLELDLREVPEGMAGWFGYDAALFDPSTVERAARHLPVLLQGIAEDPDRALGGLPHLPRAEAQQLLVEWNDTAASPAPEFLERFAGWTLAAPDAVAATDRRGAVTYGELRRRAARAAARLRQVGAGREAVVAVLAARSVDLLASLIALLEAEAVYLPLEPAHPAARRAQVLERARPALLLASGPQLEEARTAAAALPEGERPVVLALEELLAEDGVVEPQPPVPPHPEAAAYALFTSGSTGTPKGAVVRRAGMANHLLAKVEELGLGPGDTVAQNASQCFDISVWQLLAPLAAGGRVAVVEDGAAHDPVRLLERVEHERVTVLEVVPSVLGFLLDEAVTATDSRRPRLPALRRLVPTGEALPPELARRWLAAFPAVPLLNAYGPTECSDDVTHFALARPPAEGAARVPIGRGLRELRLLVLDRRLAPAPVGVAGELWVAGVGVGRGYLGEPRRTAEVFVPEPDFDRGPGAPATRRSSRLGARAYRTGDRARRLAEGTLDFLGRLDRQVKVRGFRIELGEIEAALGEHPAVRQAAVLPREAGAAGTVLAAYVAAAGETSSPSEGGLDAALREHLAARLPEPMVPAALVLLDALPLTATGKVDRRALAALDAPTVRRSAEHVPPRTPVEESLAGIWSEVLKVERVGVLDDFFEAGGQSLLATQVVSRIRQALRVELPVRVLFQKPTLEALAQEVEVALLAGQGLPEAPPLVPVPRDRPLEPSFGQERFWFIDRWRPGLTAYNIFGAVRLRGDLRAPLLARAFAEVLRRHEVLRTTFDEADGAPVQVIRPPAPLPVPVVDLRRLPAAARHRTAVALGSASAGLPFDLQAGPLLRALLVRLDERDHLLAVTAHHIVYDVWSRELLIRELGALYEALWHGRPSPLPALPVQYADFASWQRRWLRGEVLERQVGYWRERLAGLEAGSEPPADRPRPPVQSFRGARELASLSPDVTAALGRLGRERGATLFMVLLAGFYALLHRSGAGDDLAVGSPIANRIRAETEGLIGFFVNTLVLRTGAGGDPTFAELLGRTRETALGAYSHQDLAFEQLVAELEPPRDPSRQPFFQVLFNLLTNYRPVAMELPGLRLTPEANHSGAVQFDLILSIYEDGGALHFSADYATDLADRITTARLLARYATVLAAAAADPGRRVGELPVASPAERHQVALEWNDTAAPVPAGAGVHEWIAAHARRAPDAPAVTHGERGLTYGELDAAARVLAARLRRLGVGPEVLVGVHLERSPEVLVALLGVLHAGGAYLPLDPDYPEERLRFMVADSGARLVVTQRSLEGRRALDGVREVLLDGEEGETYDGSAAPGADLDPHALSYVIYTSGSTGRPKGVTVSHRNLAASTAARLARYPDPPKGFLLLSSFAFDSSVAGIFGTLAAGGRLVLPPGSRRAEGVRLGELADREGVSHLLCVPSLYAALLDEGGGEGLEAVIVAGEACHPDLVARHFATRPWTALWNEYGPTEGTVWATVQALSPDEAGAPVPIGRPVGNARVHLLGPDGRPAPAGIPGELCLGGAGVARGYLGRPAGTAAAFVPDPSGEEPGARLYRTGDLARWLPTGELLFLGRIDGQVKVRGVRVEPGEVEAALREHRAVREAAVVAVPEAGAPETAGGAPRHDRLAAYLELREGEPEPQAHALRRFLRERLPDAMVPGAFVVVDALPRTPSGKVDRGALARAGGVALAPEVPYVAPRTETEERVVGIWRELLGRDRVGVNDHFFDLGGHSLLTTRLLSRLRDAFGVEVPLPAFFEEPTVAALAEGIELARWAGEVAAGRSGAAPALAGAGEYEEGEL